MLKKLRAALAFYAPKMQASLPDRLCRSTVDSICIEDDRLNITQGPIKRSVTIAGHETSISLEPIFWDALRDAAAEEGIPVNALIARIDADRIASAVPANLASTLRVWLYARKM